MDNNLNRWARRLGMTMVLTVTSAVTAMAATPARRVADGPGVVTITESDVVQSNAKLALAYGSLLKMWTDDFTQVGRRFMAPRLIRYRGAVRTPCGIMDSGNAAYCSMANAVFYDEVFVAQQEKAVGARLGTDGDMAGIGIIAHEIGHAVAIQLGEESPDSYQNEATADCLAGAFVLQSERDGSLENGDLDEAFFGMAAAGDPAVELTGNHRIDRRIMARRSRVAHGTSEQRTSNFKAGHDGGAGACLPEFSSRR